MAVNVATAPPLDRASTNPLLLRVLSALVMAPVVLAAVWFGRPWLPALVLFAAAAMAWEWAMLCTRGSFGSIGVLIIVTGGAAVAVLSLGAGGGLALAVAVAGAASIIVMAATTRVAEPLWAAVGTLWVGLGAAAFLWLSLPPVGDRWTSLWLLAVVWTTDIAAYAAGRSIGGPRLAPRVSPNKTWSGLAGGLLGAALVGLLTASWTGRAPAALALISLGLAVAAQFGDLAESAAKRHFGVKDSSRLIPGHGGFLDRLDGLLAASAAAALVTLVAGSAPLAWR